MERKKKMANFKVNSFSFFFRYGVKQMRENRFQSKLIDEIKDRFPGAIVMKNDANYRQGIPDLLILYHDKWAALECKRTISAHHQPNQDYYVNSMNEMSYAAFIAPENKEDILNEMERTLRPKRSTRVSRGE